MENRELEAIVQQWEDDFPVVFGHDNPLDVLAPLLDRMQQAAGDDTQPMARAIMLIRRVLEDHNESAVLEALANDGYGSE